MCKISKANEFCLARYFNIYKSGRSKNKKINSSWNTHSIKKRLCAFLRIMISYLCVKSQSLTSLHCRDILYTNKRTNGRTDGRTDGRVQIYSPSQILGSVQKCNSSWNTHPINLRFCGSLCIMLGYHRVQFQRLASFCWQDILIYCLNIPK